MLAEGRRRQVVTDRRQRHAQWVGHSIDLDPVPPPKRRDGTPVDTVANPVRLSLTPVRYDLPPPALGEHTREILGHPGTKEAPRGTIREDLGNGKEEA